MKPIAEFLGFALIFVIALTIGVKAMVAKNPAPETAAAAVSGASVPLPKVSTTTNEISAEAAILVYVDENGASHPLIQKNADKPLLIASVTKLLTAAVATDNIPNISITVTKDILDKRGAIKKLSVGSSYTAATLFRALLVESNNDAAWMFAENYGVDNFVAKMNEKAKAVGMTNSSFGNPVGLDPASDMSGNTASAKDLSLLANYVYENYPQIFEITRISSTAITDTANKNTYTASSTDQLLSDNGLSVSVIGGKTGETPEAHKNLLLVFKKDPFMGYFISVVLNSSDNFADTKSLIQSISQ